MRTYEPQPGDIAACYGRDPLSLLITLGTYWPLSPPGLRLGPSHVAIMAPGTGLAPGMLWYESTTMSPRKCLFRGEVEGRAARGPQCHWPADRISDYTQRGGKVVVYRLSRHDALSSPESYRLQSMFLDMMAEDQDYDMRGAATAGLRGTRWLLDQFGKHNRDVYCSDAIAYTLIRLGRLADGNSNKYTPGRLLRVLVRNARYTRHCVIDRSGVHS